MIDRKIIDLIRMEALQAMLRNVPTGGHWRTPTVEDARFIVSLPVTAAEEREDHNEVGTRRSKTD